ncbi:co-chaperone DjlA [Phocoenobacter skyensis]|uniref:Co-chaperone protein DjlA n=1 Tax=Phocoenobacter skyensis TaxID=97481 RepID=A0A1H7XEG0_9PAST|nr:co-chaperone DjlA [Pasteurella skyensis]MDP8079679.1 co-chaperone DjlA [Pasteurella skyensis]MDP8085621.1 co-chaperone DjlA [Pasteurella skyensis]MDP8162204.1 co-chaperone DjlA [Pasteurella skyensis]MDP8172668.1 co-chaperone DjlA [Pasteurella skyensis]MDP8176830.1 co-chaperone DjlA [Pasteurella skyensis]
MQFWGKFLGFVLGYKFFGGFFGGILGCIVAHFLMKKFYETQKISSSFFQGKISRQSLFMQTTFAVLGHMAKAKGRVTQDDIQLAKQLMQRLQLDENNKELAKKAFSRGKESDFPLRQVLQEFREGCGKRGDLLRFFIEVQMQAALQDGTLEKNEEEILYTIAEMLGVSQLQFQQMLAMVAAAQRFRSGGFEGHYQGSYQQSNRYGGYHQTAQPSLKDAYVVLGVAEDADQTTVKRAYRKLMNEHHPDKLVAKGLPPEMMEVAKEKAQQIQAAYDLICKSKGWK